MEFRKMVMMTLYVRPQKRHRDKEQTFGLCVGGSSGWGKWLIHVNVWQKSLQYCKVISLQLK